MLKTNRIKRIALRAFAKINLTLEVLGERPDGYHELRTVMHSIGLFDTVTVTVEPFSGPDRYIRVRANEPLPFRNTARRAAEAYFAAADRLCPESVCGLAVSIDLKKGIPSEAGLGGASADGAAVLFALEKLIGALGTEKLYEIAPSIGADVPFCLHGGCALCEGIGERLTDCPAAELPLLIVKGERGVSTGALFRALPPAAEKAGAPSADMLEALRSGDAEAVSGLLMNDLGSAAEQVAPEIAEYRTRLLEAGAVGALMSGSGSSVYGIFRSLEAAEAALRAFPDLPFRAVSITKDGPFEEV